MTNSSLFSIIKNAAATTAVRGAFGLGRIVVLLLIAKKFGPDEFGRLALALSIVDIAKVVADLGMDIVTIRRIAVDSGRTQKLFGNILSLKLLFSTVCFLAAPAFFVWFYGNTGGVGLLFVVALSIYTTLIINAFVSYFQAKLAMAKVVVSNLAGLFFYVALTLAGIGSGLPLHGVVAAMPLSELVTLALIWRQFRKEAPLRLAFDKAVIFGILRESIYVGISGIIVVIYLRLDTLVIGWFVGNRGIGEYAVAYRLVEPFLLIFTSLSTSLYASLSGSWNTAPVPQIRQTIKRIIIPVVALALLGVVGLALFGEPFIALISDEYRESGNVLRVLSWSLLFKAVNTQLTAILNSLGKFLIITLIAAGNLLLSIGFNLILVPRFGIIGAAWSVVLVEGLNMLLQLAGVSYVTRNLLWRWPPRWKTDTRQAQTGRR